jgi:hypothetical protein
MTSPHAHLLVDLLPLDWAADRRAAALALAGSNCERIAAAAAQLGLDENAADFAAWCDAQAAAPAAPGGAP